MSFLEKYELVSMLSASETNTYRALEILTGRPVLIHQFLRGQTSPSQPDLISLVYANLPGTGTPGTEHFLDSGEDGDQVFIVTSDVPECLDLRGWLLFIAASQGDAATLPGPSAGEFAANEAFSAVSPVSPPSSQASVPPASPKAEDEGPGEFTQMFVKTESAAQESPPAAPPPSPELKPTPAVKPPDKRSRGQVPSGFEVVFQSRKPAPPVVESGPTMVLPPPPDTTGPGEFTQMFSATGEGPAADQPLPPSPPASVKPPGAVPAQPTRETAGPGEFTQMFMGMAHGQTDQPSAPPPSSPPASQAPSQPTAQKAKPGTFTQMFSIASPEAPEPQEAAAGTSHGATKRFPTPAPPAQEPPGEFTALFLSPDQTTSKIEPPLAGPSQRPATPAPGPGSRGPGEVHTPFPPSQSDSDA
ncbi:MAG TPA: hypothetical protein VEN79_13455, partial [Terriglobia bacterium]|nr:hypothetical protein [Terriglobia bacterium]